MVILINVKVNYWQFSLQSHKTKFFSGPEIGPCLLHVFGVIETESEVYSNPSSQNFVITLKILHRHAKIKKIGPVSSIMFIIRFWDR